MAKVLEANVPTSLNGYPVIESKAHENGHVTVMVQRDDHPHDPYVVATWWPELGDGWSWGHYERDMKEASFQFTVTASRNEKRGNI